MIMSCTGKGFMGRETRILMRTDRVLAGIASVSSTSLRQTSLVLGRALLPLLLLVVALGACTSPSPTSPSKTAELVRESEEPAEAPAEPPAQLQRGTPVPAKLARVPRFKPPSDDDYPGIRALPDGDLVEWPTEKVRWIQAVAVHPPAPHYEGPTDQQARLALVSYGSGLSLAVTILDDQHQSALVPGSLPGADHLELELKTEEKSPWGVRFKLGTVRQLVQVLQPVEPWREGKISSMGVAIPGGYQIEARLPLSILTPIPSPLLRQVYYRLTVFDADGEADGTAEPTLEAAGLMTLDPPLMIPEAVQKRSSVRACMATEKEALWGYENGWRCSIPYWAEGALEDDTARDSPLSLGHTIMPNPPTLVWIRERVIFINYLGVERGLAALLDKRETLLSTMKLGVVGAFNPGNVWAKESDAEALKLPDDSWAVAVTHTYPSRASGLGGRCAGGQRVYASIIALRGALTSTPTEPAPEPPTPPYLEEVFRVLLEDCASSVANDWSMSKDRRTITVHSSLYPNRPPTVYRYHQGQYRPGLKEQK